MTYAQAIRCGLIDSMLEDDAVVVLGQAVSDPKPTYGTTSGLAEKFGKDRCMNTPLSEEGMTGAAVGMALAGLRPVLVHIRADFMLLAMNQLVNMAAKVRWMYGGRLRCPMVIRAIIGKSWGQGPQHSQGVYSLLLGIPGVKVVAPVFPGAAYLALRAAIRDDDPVVFVEHRLLHGIDGTVDTDEDPDVTIQDHLIGWESPGDVTIYAVSYMAVEALRARSLLFDAGVRAEVVVPTWLSPVATGRLEQSVAGTGRLVTVDCSWVACGLGAEVGARLTEAGMLPSGQFRRLGFAPTACPTSPALEVNYYPTARSIARAAYALVTKDETWEPHAEATEPAWKGPF